MKICTWKICGKKLEVSFTDDEFHELSIASDKLEKCFTSLLATLKITLILICPSEKTLEVSDSANELYDFSDVKNIDEKQEWKIPGKNEILYN